MPPLDGLGPKKQLSPFAQAFLSYGKNKKGPAGTQPTPGSSEQPKSFEVSRKKGAFSTASQPAAGTSASASAFTSAKPNTNRPQVPPLDIPKMGNIKYERPNQKADGSPTEITGLYQRPLSDASISVSGHASMNTSSAYGGMAASPTNSLALSSENHLPNPHLSNLHLRDAVLDDSFNIFSNTPASSSAGKSRPPGDETDFPKRQDTGKAGEMPQEKQFFVTEKQPKQASFLSRMMGKQPQPKSYLIDRESFDPGKHTAHTGYTSLKNAGTSASLPDPRDSTHLRQGNSYQPPTQLPKSLIPGHRDQAGAPMLQAQAGPHQPSNRGTDAVRPLGNMSGGELKTAHQSANKEWTDLDSKLHRMNPSDSGYPVAKAQADAAFKKYVALDTEMVRRQS